jgi:hypothetical protein
VSRPRALAFLLCLPISGGLTVFAAACGDDEAFDPSEAGLPDAADGSPGRLVSDGGGGGPTLACGDAAGAPPRVLLVQGNPRTSELAVVGLDTKTVDGRLAFDGGYGTTSSLGTDPYLLGGESDQVIRLDPQAPWNVVATWDVHDDPADGGLPNANPVAVVPVSCTKAYVLRFNRDKIAIIDQSAPTGGEPKGYVDLAPLKNPKDPDTVEMTSAVYVPSKKRVFVLLGNSDLTRFVTTHDPDGDHTKLLCTAALKPSIVAIDVETDEITPIGGTAAGGGIVLEGYNPPLGSPLFYDAAADRLLVLQAGCNEELTDGGVGGIIRRSVEQVALGTQQVSTLLDLSAKDFPSTLAYADPSHAALAFFFEGFHWDPHTSALGSAIDGGIDLVALDGRGGFFGTRSTFVDGGPGPTQVLSVPLDGSGPDLVLEGPFTKLGGYVAGLEAWPPHR